jgi:hypothetical protein
MKLFGVLILVVVFGESFAQSSLFVPIESERSKITFENTILEDKTTNIMKYDYLYNGAGVGVGDFNKDGLTDIFIAGNLVDDQLYFNKGKFEFENVSLKAGITNNGWSTGVCVFDVNGDGYDDIYVCRSGPDIYKDHLNNVLYENQKDGTFQEKSAEYGLAISGHFTQAAPLDIDLDGDLDLYLMGHPAEFQHKANFQEIIKNIQAGKVESDRLLENVQGKYIDITKDAQILEYGYGLGLAITDINVDGYPDIIVCNDFDEPDHVFVNQQNNTFKDENLSYFKHTSNYSMGNDVGDFNNDGLLDYISVDMAFESHERSKMNMASMNPDKFFARVMMGWGYQYMHNMLQLNTGKGTFQEISQYSSVAKTDWSWAPLFMDIDMDGYLDLFVTNGYKRDTKNNDLKYLLDEAKEKHGEISVAEFLELIPAVKIENFFFKNNGDLTFDDKRGDWGVDEKLNSNGAAYADFDNDGDLDLVINNVDTLASVYENTTNHSTNHLILDLGELSQQEFSGLKFKFISSEGEQIQESYFARGYCSTVEKKIFFYYKDDEILPRVEITFPSNEVRLLEGIKKNRKITLTKEFLMELPMVTEDKSISTYFTEVTDDFRLEAVYNDNKFNDFESESLLPHRLSTSGPEVAVGDFDNNGYEDFIVTSAVGKIPAVFLQSPNGTFKKKTSNSFYNHQSSEDEDIAVFDVNNDKKLDLIITSGGYQFTENDTALENRLYIGNGLGMFGLVTNGMPKDLINSGKIVPEDIDGDGDTDFLICGSALPGKYPYSGKTRILMNEKGFFRDKTNFVAPQIEYVGMVNDAVFSDLDGDGDKDILLVGEWMNIVWMENVGGRYIRRKEKFDMQGWWSCIEKVDIDGDGDDDFLLGNAGMNNKYNASQKKPLDVYANDFDSNGSLDIVLAKRKGDEILPVRGKECSTGQMPNLAEKFPTFISFATSELNEIYDQDKLDNALHYTATEFRSGILYNNGEDGFGFEPFQGEGQLSFINEFKSIDINDDGRLDILAVGNRFNTEVETSRYDANCGLCFIQKEDGSFEYITPLESGFFTPYNAKSMEIISLGNDKEIGIIVGNNNNKLQLFKLNSQK